MLLWWVGGCDLGGRGRLEVGKEGLSFHRFLWLVFVKVWYMVSHVLLVIIIIVFIIVSGIFVIIMINIIIIIYHFPYHKYHHLNSL